MIRLDKYLSDAGVGTRSEVKELIRKGKIKVNGICVKDPAYKVNDESVEIEGKKVEYSQFSYYMLYKPAGVVTATEDREKTVMDLLTGINTKNLFPVGRLDKDTEGLLLITNDGQLGHNLLSPRKHVDKCYYVELAERITTDAIKELTNGVDIGDDTLTAPAKVDTISPGSIYLTITEGRYHQVKRMLKAVGNEVSYLKRVSFGPLELDPELKPGEFRPLEADELIMLTLKA